MTKKTIHPDINTIDFADSKLAGFFDDGNGYVHITTNIVDKIISGELVVTEYHETPLGNVIYLSAASQNN